MFNSGFLRLQMSLIRWAYEALCVNEFKDLKLVPAAKQVRIPYDWDNPKVKALDVLYLRLGSFKRLRWVTGVGVARVSSSCLKPL